MTIKEAQSELRALMTHLENWDKANIALDMAIESLEKENIKKPQWAIVYDDGDSFIQCRGVYENSYEALGNLIVDFEKRMEQMKKDNYEISDIVYGAVTEMETGYVYGFKAKWERIELIERFYMLEVESK